MFVWWSNYMLEFILGSYGTFCLQEKFWKPKLKAAFCKFCCLLLQVLNFLFDTLSLAVDFLLASGDFRRPSRPLKATHCCPKPPERRQTGDKVAPCSFLSEVCWTDLPAQWQPSFDHEDGLKQMSTREERRGSRRDRKIQNISSAPVYLRSDTKSIKEANFQRTLHPPSWINK